MGLVYRKLGFKVRPTGAGHPMAQQLAFMTPEERQAIAKRGQVKRQLSLDSGRADAKLKKF